MAATITSAYIHPALRQGEPAWSTEADLFPLTGIQTMRGDLRAFRHRAWKSLEAYETDRLQYDVIDAFQIVQIHFERDDVYPSISPLRLLPLLIVLWTPSPPNRYLVPLLHKVIEGRLHREHPTWLYLGVPIDEASDQGRALRAWTDGADTASPLRLPPSRSNRLALN